MNDITKAIKKKDLARNFAWIKDLYDNNKLYVGDLSVIGASIRVTPIIWEQLRLAIRLVNEIYEESWDLDIQVDSESSSEENLDRVVLQGIILHFPKINITNRDSQSHTIKDLFVKVSFGHGYNVDRRERVLRIAGISGARSTLSYAEYCSNYLHSHISANTYNQYNLSTEFYNFCTGSGEINIYQTNLNVEGFTEESFTQYLIQIMSLVSYESIEGTPYRYMRNIIVRPIDARSYNMPPNSQVLRLYNIAKAKAAEQFRNTNISPKIKFTLEDSKYSIVNDENFENYLKDCLNDRNDLERFLCYIDETGFVHRYSASVDSGIQGRYLVPSISTVPYIFRGREIPYIVEDRPQSQDTTNITFGIHPSVKKDIKKRIDENFNKYKIRKSTIDRYTDSTSDAREGVTSNTVSV